MDRRQRTVIRWMGVAFLAVGLNLGWALAAPNDLAIGPEFPMRVKSRVPEAGTWGEPSPSTGNPLVDTPLPAFSGWSRYLEPNDYLNNLTLAGEALIYTSETEFHAVELNNGQELWQATADSYFFTQWVQGNAHWYVYSLEDGTVVRSVQNGSVVLELANQHPLTLSGDTLWVTGLRHWTDPAYGFDMIDVRLIELPSGKLLHAYPTGRLTSVGACAAGLDGGLPVRTERDIALLTLDGAMQSFPLYNIRFNALLELTATGLLCVEYYDPLNAIHTEEEDAALFSSDTSFTDWYALPAGPACVARLYELESGTVAWERRYQCSADYIDLGVDYGDGKLILYLQDEYNDYYEPGGGAPRAVPLKADAAELNGQLVLNAADGTLAATCQTAAEPLLLLSNYLAANNHLYFGIPDELIGNVPTELLSDETVQTRRLDEPRLVVLDCAANTTDSLVLPADSSLKLLAIDSAWLIGLFTYADAAAAVETVSQQLVAIRLGPDGRPITGEPARLGYPDLDLAPVERFLAAADPGADQALMTDVAGLGIAGVSRLLDHLPELNPTQYDALTALCHYVDQQASSRTNYGAVYQLIEESLKYSREEYIPVVLDWLRDPATMEYRPALIGLLAACGGSLAKPVLDNLYSPYVYGARQATPPPYAFTAPETATDRLGYVRTTDEAGRVYLAYSTLYIGHRLLRTGDIYLAVDADADGAFEEVLLTGLTDQYDVYFDYYAEDASPPTEPLTVAVDGDTVTIRHHVAQPWPHIWLYRGWPDINWDLLPAQYVSTTLSLAALRLDSDSDGLTDLIEQELVTDPRNADTDGDGKRDDADIYPLADQSRMGRLERGVMRALIYRWQLQDTAYYSRGSDDPHPWRASYFTLDGCGPVAWSPDPQMYGIGLSGLAPERQLARLTRGEYSPATSVHVINQLEPITNARTEYSPMLWSPDINIAVETPSRVEYCIYFDQVLGPLNGSGDVVYLVDVDGELYPAKLQPLWIS